MDTDLDRLPPYAFVPGGPHPHPTGSPDGHSFGKVGRPPAIVDGDWQASAAYRRGFVLFHAGYYWEAHEVWEGLWHAHGRIGPTADLLKGLIKLAAAGVKVRQGQAHGVVTHAARAAACFESARQAGRQQLGLDLDEWIAMARDLAENPPTDPTSRLLGYEIGPSTKAAWDQGRP